MKLLRWGIIGLGWFGEIHAEALSAAMRFSRRPPARGAFMVGHNGSVVHLQGGTRCLPPW